ncbi:MAG: GBS Bsp-like repeat-containing protein [Oscillospiraceae bacterium]|nr:GBS Bsp-like repeat-containing protein [Oscillospiraceae bacterium]
MGRDLFKRVSSLLLVVALCLSVCPATPVRSVPAATQDQKDMVARADWYYGITWVAQQTVQGWSGTFYAGGTYHIPYGQPIYSGEYIGYAATFEEFQTAAATPGSIFYTGRSYCDGPTAPYYASDCSSFVSWVWGIERRTTYYIPDVSTSFGKVTKDRATYTLQLGDALNSASHVVLVSGLEYDGNGAITRIEITEQTPPQMKRSYYTPSQLYSKYSAYTILRYYGDVPPAPGTVEETWIEKACFDVMVYRDRNKDISHLSDADLKKHWKERGIKEGRPSSTILDLGFYRNNNPDLKEAFGDDWEAIYEHFITKGYQEHRKSSALFDGSYYCKNYPDVAENYKEQYLLHYIDHGQAEGRRASLTYDPDYYLFIRPDVAQTWPNDYTMAARHYAGHGINAQTEAYDHSAPTISDVVISDVSAAGYTVTCTVKDDWAISKVVFPAWTILNDQDDLAEQFMETQLGTPNGDTYTFRVDAADHNNEGGLYITHIYAIDRGGNQTKLVLDPVEVKDEVKRITAIAGSAYSVVDQCLKGVKLGTTVDALLTQLENEALLRVVGTDGIVLSGTDAVYTGARIELYSDGTRMDSVTVAVMGDLDGNGTVDTTDYLRIKSAFLERYAMGTAEAIAADVDGDGSITTTDHLRIKKHFLGTYELYG